MEILEEKRDNSHIFSLRGRLDSKTSAAFEKSLFAAIDTESRRIVVSCTDLDYISSAGLRVILKATKTLKPLGGSIILCSMRDYVREVFEISGFDTFLTILPSLDDALGTP